MTSKKPHCVITLDGSTVAVVSPTTEILVSLFSAGLWSDPADISLADYPNTDQQVDWTIHVTEASRPALNVDQTERSVHLQLPWPDGFAMLRALIRQTLERCNQENGIYRLHASAIQLRGNVQVFAGGSEAGKTSIALDAWRKLDARLLANDRLTLRDGPHGPEWYGGDRSVNFRAGSLARVAPDLLSAVFGSSRAQGFDTRARLDLASIDPSYSTVPPYTPVDLVALIRLDAGSDELRIKHVTTACQDIEPRRKLFEHLSARIRGSEILPVHDNGEIWLEMPIVNFDTSQLFARRVKFVDKLWQSGVLVEMAGPLTLIRSWLSSRNNQ